MSNGNQNGKGSRKHRNVSTPAYREGWDNIDWGTNIKFVDKEKFQETKKWIFEEYKEVLKRLS